MTKTLQFSETISGSLRAQVVISAKEVETILKNQGFEQIIKTVTYFEKVYHNQLVERQKHQIFYKRSGEYFSKEKAFEKAIENQNITLSN